ncbi:hypothetical protein QFC20_006065 [Naganishia adeliensis]|uniref:Uncharacterized protein n=1 Tax=Naganishia adeliensis TaxID=92952 RepID=A0ACC2VF47_9TREE|nr:hypothetical protein QFC20_006065 [Naganishia adeliensis]
MPGMETTAGSHALAGSVVPGDAIVVQHLRGAGEIIIGKANMTELSGLRAEISKSGAVEEGNVSLPTYLGEIQWGRVARDLAEKSLAMDYFQFIEVPQATFADTRSIETAFNNAVERVQMLGAEVHDPADIPCARSTDITAELDVILINEGKASVEAYYASLKHCKVRTLEELIKYLIDAVEAEGRRSKAYRDVVTEGNYVQVKSDGKLMVSPANLDTAPRIYENGMGALFNTLKLDALVVPSAHVRLVRHASVGGWVITMALNNDAAV